ncbi:berberine bridge enzyme-like 7 [Malus domestica]|uniref:berberine bridge enzyme-like 7 n=1 Tax=Malus domestica TaxID=3750 RepID=UPI000498959D
MKFFPVLLSFLLLSVSCATSAPVSFDGFLQCLTRKTQSTLPIFDSIYTTQNTSYDSILHARINNLVYSTPEYPKPLAIIAVKSVSHIQATILCAKHNGLQVKTRSGGHDFEGISYVSDVPFVMIDMFIHLNSIDVNVADESVWVQSGALIGQIYHAISTKTRVYGFPAGICPKMAAGGHFGGGGYGVMMRKYGLAIDNIVDAKIITANGKLLDRKSMGEDLFWAIRGGGSPNFGVILSWKLKLAPVPANVTVFNVKRTIAQGATDLVYKWQNVAPRMPKDLFLRAMPQVKKNSTTGEKTVEVSFIAHFLGSSDKLVALLNKRFPELGIQSTDCHEMSWVESIVFWADYPLGTPISVLLNTTNMAVYSKGKSDYVKEPLSKDVIESIWKHMIKIEKILLDINPYGGRMAEISATATPYPHRAGNLFHVMYYTYWTEAGINATNRYVRLTRELADMMTPYVSKNPREAYQNYKDLDIGVNQDNQTDFATAAVYGMKYYKDNFARLVLVKTMIDPENFFKNKQSIPTLPRVGDGYIRGILPLIESAIG